MNDLVQHNDRIALNGDLTLHSVRRLYEMSPRFDAGQVVLDLKGVGEIDSAGLALLVHWRNEAMQSSCELAFSGVPDRVRQMAEIIGVEDLFADLQWE